MYNAEYIKTHHGGLDHDALMLELRSNLDWFVDWKVKDNVGPDFLDVGCCEGTAMIGMQERGYRSHGFDVIPESHKPGCTTIAKHFSASLFPRQYHAVLCREVVEHVDDPAGMIVELFNVTHRRGFMQLQTPRPTEKENRIGYQGVHICLMSPFFIRYQLGRVGFEIKDYRMWKQGQAWLCQKR